MSNIERYIHIAKTMNSFKIGKKFTIAELAEKAKVHPITAKKAIAFFAWIQNNLKFNMSTDLSDALKNRKPHERIKMVKERKTRTKMK